MPKLEKKIDSSISERKKESAKNSVKKTKIKEDSVKKENIIKNNINKEKIEEETVIDKIKSFLTKVALMQEKAQSEDIEQKSTKESVNLEKNATKEVEKPKYMTEYYDLPYRYNEKIVKVLAQTPKRLFVYWDISDNDKEKYISTFGEDFFNKTYPVLLVYNEDKKYVKEVTINDFANSWYIDIEDSKTKYIIQLGRKFRNKPEIVNKSELEEKNIILQTDYLPIAVSNRMESPNDHVLLENIPEFITFRNVKTNEEISKSSRKFTDAYGNNYNIEDFYQMEYKNELSEEMFDMANPSSGVNSSMFK